MNSTKVQNPCRKLDKCLCLSYVFGSVLACARSAHRFQKLAQAPQQQYIVHCMHYGITLWAYLSEPLVKDNYICLRSTEIPCAQVMAQ